MITTYMNHQDLNEQDYLWNQLNEIFDGYTVIDNQLVEVDNISNDNNLPQTIQKLEIQSIKNALRAYDGNVTHSANALGIGRTNMIAKMKKYDIKYRIVSSSAGDAVVFAPPS